MQYPTRVQWVLHLSLKSRASFDDHEVIKRSTKPCILNILKIAVWKLIIHLVLNSISSKFVKYVHAEMIRCSTLPTFLRSLLGKLFIVELRLNFTTAPEYNVGLVLAILLLNIRFYR
jgi:hypothetical protein